MGRWGGSVSLMGIVSAGDDIDPAPALGQPDQPRLRHPVGNLSYVAGMTVDARGDTRNCVSAVDGGLENVPCRCSHLSASHLWAVRAHDTQRGFAGDMQECGLYLLWRGSITFGQGRHVGCLAGALCRNPLAKGAIGRRPRSIGSGLLLRIVGHVILSRREVAHRPRPAAFRRSPVPPPHRPARRGKSE